MDDKLRLRLNIFRELVDIQSLDPELRESALMNLAVESLYVGEYEIARFIVNLIIATKGAEHD